jgi:hypothetical protein
VGWAKVVAEDRPESSAAGDRLRAGLELGMEETRPVLPPLVWPETADGVTAEGATGEGATADGATGDEAAVDGAAGWAGIAAAGAGPADWAELPVSALPLQADGLPGVLPASPVCWPNPGVASEHRIAAVKKNRADMLQPPCRSRRV